MIIDVYPKIGSLFTVISQVLLKKENYTFILILQWVLIMFVPRELKHHKNSKY